MSKQRIIKGLVVFLLLAIAVYTAFILFTDAEKNLEAFQSFTWYLFPAVIALVLVNFLLRELKWDFFRRAAGLSDIPRMGSFLVFFSGYSMCISPGRVGELIKPGLYKYYYGAPWKKSVPLVFCERLTDLLGMVILCIGTGFFYFNGVKGAGTEGVTDLYWTTDKIAIWFVCAITALTILIGLARWRKFVEGSIALVEKVTKLSGPAEKIRHLYDETFPLLTFRNLSMMSLLGAFSWSFECLAMYVICYGLGISDIDPSALPAGATGVTFLHCVFVFCIASIIGGLFFFTPGGLGPVDLLMQQMLAALGVAGSLATFTMFLTRFSTLIFGAALGFLFLSITARYHRDADIFTHMSKAIDEVEAAEKAAEEAASAS